MTWTEGIHAIPPDEYHRDHAPEPALSAGLAHVLLTKSPKHAWTESCRLNPDYRERHGDSFDLGTAVHDLWLRGQENVAIVEANDWRTKKAQEEKAAAYEAGLTPLLAKDWQRVQEMSAAIREQLAERDDDPPLFANGGKPEQAVVWQERGIWCRALVDWLSVTDGLAVIDDLKSTGQSANPFAWTRTTMWNIGADIQLAMHSRGVEAVTRKQTLMRYCVVETTRPYALSVVTLGDKALQFANERVDQAIDTWRECLATGEWPMYVKELCYAEPQPWREAQWLEQQGISEAAA